MKGVTIDEAAGTATVGAGLTQKETVPALGQRGFVIPTASEGGVGLGGVVLGGGFGAHDAHGARHARRLRRRGEPCRGGQGCPSHISGPEHNRGILAYVTGTAD